MPQQQKPSMQDVHAQDDIEREVEHRLMVELQNRKARLREEIVARMQHEAQMKHLDRINARHPIQDKLAGLTPEQEAQRQRDMAARTKASSEKMDRANARVVPGSRAALRAARADGAGGGSSFRIRS